MINHTAGVCGLLISSGAFPVPIISAIAFRQGARVAGTVVDAGRHRRTSSLACDALSG